MSNILIKCTKYLKKQFINYLFIAINVEYNFK